MSSLAGAGSLIWSVRQDMWPFSRKKPREGASKSPSLAAALEHLAGIGIRVRPGISHEDLLHSLGGSMESSVDWVQLLCVLGSEVERGAFERISDDIWHFDAECIEDQGDYVRVVQRFVILAKGALPLSDIHDHVDVEAEEAWIEFTLEGKKVHWDLKVSDDWVDTDLYSQLQRMVAPRAAGKRFFIVALGQDSLISFGDDQMKQALSNFSGLKFQWE
jgi:hypothetical protein